MISDGIEGERRAVEVRDRRCVKYRIIFFGTMKRISVNMHRKRSFHAL